MDEAGGLGIQRFPHPPTRKHALRDRACGPPLLTPLLLPLYPAYDVHMRAQSIDSPAAEGIIALAWMESSALF